ncbi:MAG: sulfur carrier protein ThiS [Acidobacteriota bacterium]|nr:sulfur carrier protein ThiS [Acidobacteriota bacterium]
MKIIINGKTKEISNEVNIIELLESFSLPKERIAIELNKQVVRKKDWGNIKITDADRIEVIHFVGGG